MKKMTLLEMVQNIASALETDEIESITDTTESLQIAEVIKETFYEQFNNIFIAEHQRLFAFDTVAGSLSPSYLKVPADVSKILWIKYRDYRSDDSYRTVPYVSPEQFLAMQFSYTEDFVNVVETADPSSGVKYFVRTDAPPTCFTIFDDEYIAFDSFDLDFEAKVAGANAVGYGTKTFEFEMEDDFVPPLDGNLFPLLLAESKSVCFVNLKQVSSAKEEQRARRQRIRMQNDQFKARKAQYSYWATGNNFARRR